jgi:hypothetical protein
MRNCFLDFDRVFAPVKPQKDVDVCRVYVTTQIAFCLAQVLDFVGYFLKIK